MFEWFNNVFTWFKDIADSLLAFFIGLVNGLINIVKAIPQLVSFLYQSFGYLPSVLIAFAALTITISTVYLIVGRETGG